MPDLLAGSLMTAAALILGVTGIGLVVVLRRPSALERMMAVQLLGTGGAAVLLLLGAAANDPTLADVALVVVLLAALSGAALALGNRPAAPAEPHRRDGP